MACLNLVHTSYSVVCLAFRFLAMKFILASRISFAGNVRVAVGLGCAGDHRA